MSLLSSRLRLRHPDLRAAVPAGRSGEETGAGKQVRVGQADQGRKGSNAAQDHLLPQPDGHESGEVSQGPFIIR